MSMRTTAGRYFPPQEQTGGSSGDPAIGENARSFHHRWLEDPERPQDSIRASLAEQIWG